MFGRLLLLSLLSASILRADTPPSVSAKNDLKSDKLPLKVSVGADGTATVRIVNDSAQPRLLFATSGSVNEGIKLAMEFVQFSKDSQLEMWEHRNLVFHGERPSSPLVATLNPGEEAIATLAFSKLSDPSDPKSKRVPLAKGTYRLRIPFASGEEMAKAATSGTLLPPAITIEVSAEESQHD